MEAEQAEERFGQAMVDIAEFMHRRLAEEPDLLDHRLAGDLRAWATRLGVRGAERVRPGRPEVARRGRPAARPALQVLPGGAP